MAAGSGGSGNQQKLTVAVGCRVSCTTCNGEKVEGEVLCETSHKILVLSILFIT